jgi:hypothetical protein
MSKEELEFRLFEYLEGDLSPEEMEEVEQMVLEDDALKQELELLKRATLHAEPLVYANKESLKKSSTIIPLWIGTSVAIKSAAAAALIVATIGVYQWINSSPDNAATIAADTHLPVTSDEKEVPQMNHAELNNLADALGTKDRKKERLKDGMDHPRLERNNPTAIVEHGEDQPQFSEHTSVQENKSLVRIDIPGFKESIALVSSPIKNQVIMKPIQFKSQNLTLSEDEYSTHWSKGLRNGVVGVFIHGIRNIKSTKLKLEKSEDNAPVLVLSTKNYEVLAQLNNRNNNIQQN